MTLKHQQDNKRFNEMWSPATRKKKKRSFQIHTLKSTKEERTTFIRFQLSFFQFCPTIILLHSWAQLLILNTLQGTRNRSDAAREQLAGLKPGQPPQGSHQISAPAAAPPKRPYRQGKKMKHLNLPISKSSASLCTFSHEFSHCLCYKLFEHKHNAVSSL